jgi:hypothetical protein
VARVPPVLVLEGKAVASVTVEIVPGLNCIAASTTVVAPERTDSLENCVV